MRKYAQSIIQPGIKLIDMCEKIENMNRLLVQEHAIFSVIGPEGAAAILHRDPSRAPEVAEQLRLTSTDLLELDIVDAVVPDDTAATVKAIVTALDEGLRVAQPAPAG